MNMRITKTASFDKAHLKITYDGHQYEYYFESLIDGSVIATGGGNINFDITEAYIQEHVQELGSSFIERYVYLKHVDSVLVKNKE